jgi:hypothetical protein
MGRKNCIGYHRKRRYGYKKQQQTTTTDPESIVNELWLASSPVDLDCLSFDEEEEEPEEIIHSVAEYITKNDEVCDDTLESTASRITIAYVFISLGAPENTKTNPWVVQGSHHCLNAKVKKILDLPAWADTAGVFRRLSRLPICWNQVYWCSTCW